MSVLIKGMDMPKSCYECRFCAGTIEGCICAMGCGLLEFDTSKEIHPKCPLVEVPTPHGDLIDRQKLLEDNKYLEYPTDEKYRRDRAWAVGFNSGARHCNEHAVYAKTVIKAEDEQ